MLRDVPAHLSDILVSITEAEQEVWQYMDHVWLKQLPQHVAQHLEGKQGSCIERQLLFELLFLSLNKLLMQMVT